MALNAQGYFNALRSYLNTNHYEVIATEAGKVLLKEKVYFAGNQEKEYRVRLSAPGETIVIKLDKKNSKGKSDPLFHFLDDTGMPWSKRCDFVIFHFYQNKISVLIFEFKSNTFPDGLIDQVNSTVAWCRALHSIIKIYTDKSKRLCIKKFVLSTHPDPAPYLDAAGKYLRRDHTIRHYLYRDIDGMSIDSLDNTNVEEIN
jgi:hypothetical protein